MNYADLTNVKQPAGWVKNPHWNLRRYPPHVLTQSDEAESRRFIENGWLWSNRDRWTFTVHIVNWLNTNVGRVNTDWEIADSNVPENVRVYFRLKHHAMTFKLVFG
jgi:hypothetical protein